MGFLNHLKTTIAWIQFDDDYLNVPGFYAGGHYVDEDEVEEPRTMKQAYGNPQGSIKNDGVSCLHEQIGENDDVNDIPRDKFRPCGGCLAPLGRYAL